jgi:hypothetical protein
MKTAREKVLLEPKQKKQLEDFSSATGIPKTEIIRRALGRYLLEESPQQHPEIAPEIEKAWAKEARRRLEEICSGEVEAIPGEQVHQELKDLLAE